MSDQKPFHAPKDHYKIVGTLIGPHGETVELIDRAEYDKMAARLVEAEKILRVTCNFDDAFGFPTFTEWGHITSVAREYFENHRGGE